MSTVSLFARTPRAGRHNHRFLASPDDVRSGEELAQLFERAAGSGDVVTSARRVIQPSTGREGEEILLLVVNPPARLTDARRAELRRRLEETSAELDKLVTASIDWEREGQELVVPRPELRAWADGLGKLVTASIDWEREGQELVVPRPELPACADGKARSLTSPQPRPWLLLGALAVALVIALVGVPAYLMWQSKGGAPKQEQRHDEKANYDEWVRHMTVAEKGRQSLTEDQLQLGLIECVRGASLTKDEKNVIDSSWGKIEDTKRIEKEKPADRVHSLSKVDAVKSYLKEKPYSPTHFIRNDSQKDHLDSLLPKTEGGVPPRQTVEIRKCLWKAAMKLAEMRNAVDTSFADADVKTESEPAKIFLELLRLPKKGFNPTQVKNIQHKFGDQQPVPIFSRADGEGADSLTIYLKELLAFADKMEKEKQSSQKDREKKERKLGETIAEVVKLWNAKGGEGSKLDDLLTHGNGKLSDGFNDHKELVKSKRACDKCLREFLDLLVELKQAQSPPR